MEILGNISQSQSGESASNGNSSSGSSLLGAEFSSLLGEVNSGQLAGNIFATMQNTGLLGGDSTWTSCLQDGTRTSLMDERAQRDRLSDEDDPDADQNDDPNEDEEEQQRAEDVDTERTAVSESRFAESLAATVTEGSAGRGEAQPAVRAPAENPGAAGRGEGQLSESLSGKLSESLSGKESALQQSLNSSRLKESDLSLALKQSAVPSQKSSGITTAELDQMAKDLRVNQLQLNVYAKNGFLPGSQGSTAMAVAQPSVYAGAGTEALDLISKSVELAGTLEQQVQDGGSAKSASWKITGAENGEQEPEQQQQQFQQQARDELGRALQQLKDAGSAFAGMRGTFTMQGGGIRAAAGSAPAAAVMNGTAEAGGSEFESSSLFTLSGKDSAGKLNESMRGQQSAAAQMMKFGGNTQQNAEEIASQVMKMAARNLRTLEISLNPEQLGKMKISFELQGTEAAKVSIASLNPVTRELVGECLGRLREIFAENDLDIEAELAEYTESGSSDGGSDFASEQEAAQERQQQGAGAPPLFAGGGEEETDSADTDVDEEADGIMSLFDEEGITPPQHRSAGISYMV